MDTLPLVWRTGDPDLYEKARVGRVFNQRQPNRYPDAIVEASQAAHVVEAVKLAIERKCRIAVRSGGHNWSASSVRDDSILVDLGKCREMTLDQNTGIVQVSPSTTSAELNAYLHPFGRMFAGGHCPDVAVGGFLLLGGVGWNARNWGCACEQVLAIEVVTADGRLLRADPTQNTDLYWAARGCGPGFPGVITRFHLQTRPLTKVMRSSLYIYPTDRYRSVFEWVLELTPPFDNETEIVMISTHPPGLDDLHLMVLFITFKDSEDSAKDALQPAEDSFPSDPVLHWFCQKTDLPNEYAGQAHANPSGHRYHCENAYIRNGEDVVSVLEKAMTTSPSKETYTFWNPMFPWSRRSLPDMALSLQADHYLAMYTICKYEADDAKCMNWTRDIIADVKKYSVGSYLGDIDLQVRTTKFWGDEQARRLMDIRRKWDPNGVICGYLDAGDKSGVAGLDNQLDNGKD
ncbi:hypothetical protein B0A52_03868 [Exophiala mesophila]|uniref:FAD-binding PCMH-type domain-containing protein n=1 Tax=Exophiala mesophila TaxID=212818 RepID=A0A438N7F4_EXOME|nr:hypothetical protein B0A52_03868 [Exophiala mesophila]